MDVIAQCVGKLWIIMQRPCFIPPTFLRKGKNKWTTLMPKATDYVVAGLNVTSW